MDIMKTPWPKELVDKLNELINWKSEQIGKSNRANIISIFAILVTIVGLITHLLLKF